MNFGFEKLKNIGAQKIHEQTHIARHHVQAVLHESFDDINKIQFLGFISILEREYDVELDELKAKGLAHFDEVEVPLEEESKVFTPKTKQKNSTSIYIIVALFIFIVVVLYQMVSSPSTQVQELDNSAIENVQNTISPVIEANATQDTNDTLLVTPEELPSVNDFTITPKYKLWVGYIELPTHRKHQKTIEAGETLELDPDKDWLLSLGHGSVDFEIDGNTTEYRDRKNLRFLYTKDGNLTKIRFSKFKELNRGDEW